MGTIESDEDWDDDYEDAPDDSEEADTIPCPNCGAEIYEESPRCPICGEYVVSNSRRVWSGKPVWYIVLALLGIAAVCLVMAFGH